jgi:hypothetical protein
MVPASKFVVCELLLKMEHNQALQTINLCRNTLVHDHVTKLAFCPLEGYTHELGESLKSNAPIVALNNSNVVLNQLFDKLACVGFRVLCLLLERFELL